ncbi:hypothetical protein GJ496_007346 [Pomphorhynchus laevis]|nr:hypothetical protein GJ496_007346 [Pomphorhynchus laevis]
MMQKSNKGSENRINLENFSKSNFVEDTRRSYQLDVPRDSGKLSCDNVISMTTSEKHNDKLPSNAKVVNYDLSVNHNSATDLRGVPMLLTQDFAILSEANMLHIVDQFGIQMTVNNADLNKLTGYNGSMLDLDKHSVIIYTLITMPKAKQLQDMFAAELRRELQRRNLDNSGTKQIMLDRLKKALTESNENLDA